MATKKSQQLIHVTLAKCPVNLLIEFVSFIDLFPEYLFDFLVQKKILWNVWTGTI